MPQWGLDNLGENLVFEDPSAAAAEREEQCDQIKIVKCL